LTENLYKSVRTHHKPTPDWKMPTITLFGVMLLLALGGAIFTVMRTQYFYNRFRTDLLYSVVYARENNSFAAYAGDEELTREIPDNFLGAIGGQGRPTHAPQDPADLTVSFGNGSSVCVWNTQFADYSRGHGAVWKPGIVLEYTGVDGRQYIIEREDDFFYLQFWLSGQIKDYYHPTEEESASLQAFLEKIS